MQIKISSFVALILLTALNAFPFDSLVINLPGDVPLVMVKIPRGSFIMGSPEKAGSPWNSCEWIHGICDTPQHKVTIDYDFYMGKYEITQGQWQAVTGTNPSTFNKFGSDYPVESVSYDDCQKFCEKLNSLTLIGSIEKFRLPSESEWEYSCRAGTTTRFFFGDAPDCSPTNTPCSILDEYAWWGGNSLDGRTKPVGKKKPNPWGLYDMLGNVYEWCEDPWESGYMDHPTDGSARIGNSIRHLTRGSWRGYKDPLKFTSYFRAEHNDTLRHGCCGVRIAASINTQPSKTIPDQHRSIKSANALGCNQIADRKFAFYSNVYSPVRIYNLKGVQIAEIPAFGKKAPYTAIWNVTKIHEIPAACYIAVQKEWPRTSVLFKLDK